MENYRVTVGQLAVIMVALLLSVPGVSAAASWMYKQDSEKLTDKQYSFAAGFAFDYKYNNDFTVSFQCTESKIRFEIDVDTLINSKGDEFPFAYRVDKRDSRQITMRTYSNQNQGGYTYSDVKRIAKDILGGSKMFVRAVTWDNDYLEAQISLFRSDSAIRRVFSDCGESLDASQADSKSIYSLNKFNSSFKKLTPARQKKMLEELERMMSKY